MFVCIFCTCIPYCVLDYTELNVENFGQDYPRFEYWFCHWPWLRRRSNPPRYAAIHHPQVPDTARKQHQRRSSLITYCRSCSDLPRHPCFCRTSWAPVGKHTSTLSRPTPREGAYTLLLLSRFTCLCRTAVPSLYLCLLRISLGTATVLSSLF